MKFSLKKIFSKDTHDNLIISIIVILLTFLILYFYYIYISDKGIEYFSLSSLKLYMIDWGSLIGVVSSLLITYLIAITPKRVDNKINKISDAIQSPLNDFKEIFNETCHILEWINGDKDSSIFITSATPIFGIELGEDYHKRWLNLLNTRLDSKLKTTLYCMDWQPCKNSNVSTSPLYTFIRSLAKYSLIKEEDIMGLFKKGIKSYYNLKKYNDKSFMLLCGTKLTTQVILAKKGNGETKGIIYFTTIRSKNDHIVSGIRTSDLKWNGIMENIIEYCQQNSFDAIYKMSLFDWTDAQIDRSLELFEDQLSLEPVRIDGFDIDIFDGVFSPNKGKSTELLIKVINLVCKQLGDRKKCGIDIGTGTGILGLCLSRYCQKMFLTDISGIAIENAKGNFNKNKINAKEIYFYTCNLLNDEIIQSISQEEYPVFVFNYPFYPSFFALDEKSETGLKIVDNFLSLIKEVIRNKGVAILPGNQLSGEFDPMQTAKNYNLYTHKVNISEKNNAVYLIYSKSQEETIDFDCI